MTVLKNILLTPIVFVLTLFLAVFIALFDLIRFPVEMVAEIWR